MWARPLTLLSGIIPKYFGQGGYGYYYDGNQRIFCIVLAYEGFPSDKSNWDIRVEGYRDPDVIKKNINALNQSVASIIRDAGRMSSNYEKITYFNEWLTTNNQYNYTIAYTNNSADRMIYTSLGALTTKDGSPGGGRIGCDGPVCTGYAKAFLLLCQNADIPACWTLEQIMRGTMFRWIRRIPDGMQWM